MHDFLSMFSTQIPSAAEVEADQKQKLTIPIL